MNFYKAQQADGYLDIVRENDPALKYLAFGKLSLKEGQKYRGITNGYETALVILTGTVSISCEEQEWENLGGRNNFFEGKATTVYAPCQSDYSVFAQSDVEIAVCKVRADQKFSPFVVKPDEVTVSKRGKETWIREVHDIIADQAEGRVQRIVLGETFNHEGHWSSYPPHKHDGEHFPEEPNMEEIYHYQINPEHGFGVQLHYTKDGTIDNAYMIRHGDTFVIDRGYHPVSAAGGYQVYYLWFMAGDAGRVLRPYDDPVHAWLK
jgi:5-deoxy-glucuronate isomerase